MSIILVVNNRAEMGPMTSVIAALPEAQVLGLTDLQQRGDPAKVMSFGLWWFNREFEERKPRLVVVLGDRYETLSAALAAMFLRIPVAHIHGGETTAGAFDDVLRHAVTHASTLHFVATQAAKKRVVKLIGKLSDPSNNFGKVYYVGAPGLDGIEGNSARRDRKLILVTYHPETRAPDYGLANCRTMLEAVESFHTDGYHVAFCGVNQDPGCREVAYAQIDWAKNHKNASWHEDESRSWYIERVQEAALCLGNSSSFVIESPWVGCPSVLVGDRQLGRELSNSVFQDDYDIRGAITRALSWNGPWTPVYRGGAASSIASVVRAYVQQQQVPA